MPRDLPITQGLTDNYISFDCMSPGGVKFTSVQLPLTSKGEIKKLITWVQKRARLKGAYEVVPVEYCLNGVKETLHG